MRTVKSSLFSVLPITSQHVFDFFFGMTKWRSLLPRVSVRDFSREKSCIKHGELIVRDFVAQLRGIQLFVRAVLAKGRVMNKICGHAVKVTPHT